jgi:MFS family permease
MRSVLFALIPLFASLALISGGSSYLITLIGIQLGAQGVQPMHVGYVMSCYSLGFVLGTIFTPKLLLKVGHIRAFAALASMTGITVISYPISEDIVFWALLRGVGGFFIAGLYIVIESWLSATTTPNNRTKVFAFYLLSSYSASASAQQFIGHGVSLGVYIAFTIGAIMIFASSVPLSITSRQSPSLDESTSMSPFRLAKRAILGLVGALAGGFMLGTFYGLVPLYSTMTGLNSYDIGNLMSLSITLAMVCAWPIGWLADRVPRSVVMLGLIVISGSAALLALLFGTQMPSILFVCVPVIMACSASIYSISVAITQDLVENEERVSASSTLLMAYGVGSIVGPMIGSWSMQNVGPSALFACFIGVLTALGVFTLYRQSRQAPLPVELQEQFKPIIPEVQVNGELLSFDGVEANPERDGETAAPNEEGLDECIEHHADSAERTKP